MNPMDVAKNLGDEVQTGQGDAGGIFGKVGGFMKEKPELTSIILDYLGSGLAGRDEGNIFAGLGTQLAKSSLSEKALKDIAGQKNQSQERLMKAFTDILGGRTPAEDSFTAPGLTGLNKVIQTGKKEGGGSNVQIDADITDDSTIEGEQDVGATGATGTSELDSKKIFETLSPNFLAP